MTARPRAVFDSLLRKVMQTLTKFLREVRIELSKVSWPTRKQTIQYTLAVVGVSVALAVFLGLLDAIFSAGINRLLIR